jgi:hypothetical protein
MQIRIIHLQGRNRLLGAALLVAALGLVLAVALFGLALLAGMTVLGGLGLLVRRVFGGHSRPAQTLLDPSLEVFSPTEPRPRNQLPPRSN